MHFIENAVGVSRFSRLQLRPKHVEYTTPTAQPYLKQKSFMLLIVLSQFDEDLNVELDAIIRVSDTMYMCGCIEYIRSRDFLFSNHCALGCQKWVKRGPTPPGAQPLDGRAVKVALFARYG